MLSIRSATRQRIGTYDYLVLPRTGPWVETGNWLESHHPGYPSNRIMIRKSFLRKGVSIFVRDNAKLYRQGSHLALGGTSGLGNTFFYRYLIWSSFHPDGIEVDTITETVFCGRIQKNGKDIFITRARFIQSRLSEPSLGRQSHKICAIIKMLG